jgi:hypothetical protein
MKVPNEFRVRTGLLGSDETLGNNGAFLIPFRSYTFSVVASDELGWEHVSVSLPSRCPNWEEMCYIKELFWEDTECVVQFHPSKDDYVNNHNYCLHLWKQLGVEFPKPHYLLVGIKKSNVIGDYLSEEEK